MARKSGNINLGVGVNTKNAEKDLNSFAKKTNSKLNQMFGTEIGGGVSDSISKIINPANLATAAVTAVGVAVVGTTTALALYGKEAVKAANEISKFAKNTQISVESISSLFTAMKKGGGDIDGVGDIVQDFTEKFGDAKSGSETYRESLRALGVDLTGTTEQAIKQAITSLGNMEDKSKALFRGIELFGDQYKTLANQINSGNNIFQQSPLFSKEFIKASEELTKNTKKMEIEFKTALNNGLTPFIESVNVLFDYLEDSGAWDTFLDGVELTLQGLYKLLEPIRLVIEGMDIINKENRMDDLAKQIDSVSKAFDLDILDAYGKKIGEINEELLASENPEYWNEKKKNTEKLLQLEKEYYTLTKLLTGMAPTKDFMFFDPVKYEAGLKKLKQGTEDQREALQKLIEQNKKLVTERGLILTVDKIGYSYGRLLETLTGVNDATLDSTSIRIKQKDEIHNLGSEVENTIEQLELLKQSKIDDKSASDTWLTKINSQIDKLKNFREQVKKTYEDDDLIKKFVDEQISELNRLKELESKSFITGFNINLMEEGLDKEKALIEQSYDNLKNGLDEKRDLLQDDQFNKLSIDLANWREAELTKIQENGMMERFNLFQEQFGHWNSLAQQLVSGFDTIASLRKSISDKETQDMLDADKERINNMRISDRRKEQLIKQAEEKADAIKAEQFEKDKKRQIAGVWMNLGSAVMSAWASAMQIQPLPVGVALGGVQTAALTAIAGVQSGLISKQKYAMGGILGGASHANGGIPTQFGELEGGEAVINKRSTAMFRNELSAINQAGGGRAFGNGRASFGSSRIINIKMGDIIVEGNATEDVINDIRAVSDDRLERLKEDIITLQIAGEI